MAKNIKNIIRDIEKWRDENKEQRSVIVMIGEPAEGDKEKMAVTVGIMGDLNNLCAVLDEAKYHAPFGVIDNRVNAHALLRGSKGACGGDKDGDKETPAWEE